MNRERVDKAWLDVARDLGKTDRDGEVYLLRSEIERLRAALELSQSQNYCTLCGRALEPKP